MEVTSLGKKSLKIRGRKASFIVDPKEDMPKASADAILVLEPDFDQSRVTDARVIINGPGEFEIGGVKILGISGENGPSYSLDIDNVKVLVGKVSSISKLVDKLAEHQVAIFNVDGEIGESVITAVEPNLVLLYGDKMEEGAKKIGKEEKEITKSKKVVITADKLPEELEVIELA